MIDKHYRLSRASVPELPSVSSNDILRQITIAFEHLEQTKAVANLLPEHPIYSGVSMTASEQADLLNFVREYIWPTPDIMDVTFNAAAQSASSSRMSVGESFAAVAESVGR